MLVSTSSVRLFLFFFFNDTATTEIYTLSLHDALPISQRCSATASSSRRATSRTLLRCAARLRTLKASFLRAPTSRVRRSEEHTSELQSRQYLVCRLLLEKKKKTDSSYMSNYNDIQVSV